MASNWAQHMGDTSGQARREKADAKLVASGQSKLVDTIAANVPGAASMLRASNVSDGEAWAMLTDPNTMKGIKVIVEGLGGVTKWIEKMGEKGPKKKGKKGGREAPLLQYQHT